MLLFSHPYPAFHKVITRPRDFAFGSASGTLITAGNSAYGSYAEIMDNADVTHDIYGFDVIIGNGGQTGTIVTIGTDPAGGTSYTDLIRDILVGRDSNFANGNEATGGFGYILHFPVFVKAGSSVAMKARSVAALNFNCYTTAYMLPKDPTTIRIGGTTTAFGVNSHFGTSITPGTSGADGSWVDLGAISGDHFYWDYGISCQDASMSSSAYRIDIAFGDGSNKRIAIQDRWVHNGNERINRMPYSMQNWTLGRNGENVYARMSCSTTPDDTMGVSVYGVK